MKRTATLLAACATTLAAAVATAPAVGSATASAVAEVRCADGAPASAKLMRGSTAKDPNSLSAAQVRAMERRFGDRLASLSDAKRAGLRSKAPISVPVVWQVITNGGAGTNVSDAQIKRQLTVMNRGYNGAASGPGVNTTFRFKTKQIVRTNKATAYAWDDTDDLTTKPQLRKGGPKVLNVYVVDSIVLQGQTGILGYATFPSDYQSSPDQDGVVVLRGSFPGGNTAPYNLGDTLTHEAGHWLGLYHTFQGGCSAQGDRVKDTPAQDDGDNIFSCDATLNTCPSAGRDPVHNYMSYGDDKCLERFSKGQGTRMRAQWFAFRG